MYNTCDSTEWGLQTLGEEEPDDPEAVAAAAALAGAQRVAMAKAVSAQIEQEEKEQAAREVLFQMSSRSPTHNHRRLNSDELSTSDAALNREEKLLLLMKTVSMPILNDVDDSESTSMRRKLSAYMFPPTHARDSSESVSSIVSALSSEDETRYERITSLGGTQRLVKITSPRTNHQEQKLEIEAAWQISRGNSLEAERKRRMGAFKYLQKPGFDWMKSWKFADFWTQPMALPVAWVYFQSQNHQHRKRSEIPLSRGGLPLDHWKSSFSHRCQGCISSTEAFANFVSSSLKEHSFTLITSNTLLAILTTPCLEQFTSVREVMVDRFNCLGRKVVNAGVWRALLLSAQNCQLNLRHHVFRDIYSLVLTSTENCWSLLEFPWWQRVLFPALCYLQNGLTLHKQPQKKGGFLKRGISGSSGDERISAALIEETKDQREQQHGCTLFSVPEVDTDGQEDVLALNQKIYLYVTRIFAKLHQSAFNAAGDGDRNASILSRHPDRLQGIVVDPANTFARTPPTRNTHLNSPTNTLNRSISSSTSINNKTISNKSLSKEDGGRVETVLPDCFFLQQLGESLMVALGGCSTCNVEFHYRVVTQLLGQCIALEKYPQTLTWSQWRCVARVVALAKYLIFCPTHELFDPAQFFNADSLQFRESKRERRRSSSVGSFSQSSPSTQRGVFSFDDMHTGLSGTFGRFSNLSVSYTPSLAPWIGFLDLSVTGRVALDMLLGAGDGDFLAKVKNFFFQKPENCALHDDPCSEADLQMVRLLLGALKSFKVYRISSVKKVTDLKKTIQKTREIFLEASVDSMERQGQGDKQTQRLISQIRCQVPFFCDVVPFLQLVRSRKLFLSSNQQAETAANFLGKSKRWVTLAPVSEVIKKGLVCDDPQMVEKHRELELMRIKSKNYPKQGAVSPVVLQQLMQLPAGQQSFSNIKHRVSKIKF